MIQQNNQKRSHVAAALLLLFILGCQQNPNTVTGTVLADGKPMTISADTRGTVVFEPASGQGPVATGILDSTGRFKLATGGLPEVTPAKYHVAISVVQLLARSDEMEQSAKLISPTKYASASNSGLEANVVPGANEFNFDLVTNDAGETPGAAEVASPTSAPMETAAPTGTTQK